MQPNSTSALKLPGPDLLPWRSQAQAISVTRLALDVATLTNVAQTGSPAGYLSPVPFPVDCFQA